MNYFSGKKVWIVGASAGIGEALALKLATMGATIISSARNSESIELLTNRLNEINGYSNHFVPLDVSDLQSVESAAKNVGDYDIAIFMAGVYKPMTAQDFDLATAQQTLDVNLKGYVNFLGVVLPKFVSANKGHLVAVSSVAGYVGLPGGFTYGASKAGMSNLTESIRCDLKGTGVKVQMVSPGFVKTRLTDKNTFKMPMIISAEKAAEHIVSGMVKNSFEIHFPKPFSMILKFLRFLPYSLYFRLMPAKK
jgi:short-subunit dehydrogenase